MWVWPLGLPSVSDQLAYNFKTTVSPTSMQDAQIAHNKAVQRIESMKQPWDVVSYSAGEEYTRRWQMVSVKEVVGRIIDIKA